MQITAQLNQDGLLVHAVQLCLAIVSLLMMPVLMAWTWIHFFALQFNLQIVALQEVLALCGIAAVYSLDRLIDPDPRLYSLNRHGLVQALRLIFVIAMVGSVICMFLMDFAPWQVALCCIALSVANWLGKKVCMGKTIFVTAAWICSCTLLPFAPYAWTAEIYLTIVLWAILFAAACILCDIKDIESDRQKKVRSLPVLIGIGKSLNIIKYLLVLILPLLLYIAPIEFVVLCGLLLLCSRCKSYLDDPLLAPFCVDGCLFLSACVVFFV